MKPTHRLELHNGRVAHVRAPIYCHPTRPDHFAVRTAHLELLGIVQRLEGFYDCSIDPILFVEFERLYQAIGELLTPKVNAAEISSTARHKFFISQGLVAFGEGQAIAPSGLEELMGYKLPDAIDAIPPEQESQQTPIRLTSGDDDADLIAALHITFKGSAEMMMRSHSRSDLIKILDQANNLLRGEEALKEKQQEADRALFEQHKDQFDALAQSTGGFFF